MSVQGFTNPGPEAIRALLQRVRSIAIVGLSPEPSRPSHGVGAALQCFGYRIIPVRPGVSSVLGETAYPDLRQVPEPIDLVDVFRAPEHVGPIVEVCIERGVPALWLQDGVVNIPAARRAQAAGMVVVIDRCICRDYLALCNSRPEVGFPSGDRGE